ncbi:MAG: helix-turn-helix domain-containing protein [Candidatus Saccharibacteria bacterium]
MGELGKQMKLLRQQYELTQQELADALHIGKSAIALYETGRRQPDPETLDKIADFFDVSVDYLLGRTHAPGNAPHSASGSRVSIQARSLADALLKISELKFELELSEDEFLGLVKRAVAHYGPPDTGGIAAHRRGQSGGVRHD